jgi:hypothetical protein
MLRSSKTVLLVDAAINLSLGALLLAFPQPVVEYLGVPPTEVLFYPKILGAVLFGIGISLVIESRRRTQGMVGLGLAGAVAINLSGGLVLAALLILGDLGLPLRGSIFLWGLVLLLTIVSGIELLIQPRRED